MWVGFGWGSMESLAEENERVWLLLELAVSKHGKQMMDRATCNGKDGIVTSLQ